MPTLLTPSQIKQDVALYLPKSGYDNIFVPQGPLEIADQEGCSLSAYQDTRGYWTIGLGHRPAHPGEVWSYQTCLEIFFNDIYAKAYQPLQQSAPWMFELSMPRLWANFSAAFNLGAEGWLSFGATLSAMAGDNWQQTILGMKDSLWYTQVPDRVKALAYQLYFDTWVEGYLDDSQTAQIDQLLGG